MTEDDTDSTKIAVMASKVDYMQRDISDIKANVQQGYVTKDEFKPIKTIVYGLVGIILTAVIGAIVSVVIIK